MLNGAESHLTFNTQHLKFLIMKLTLILLITITIILITTTIAFAQPPGLPATPDQAPIDGGLGLLAALGGAYAWKRLRQNHNKE